MQFMGLYQIIIAITFLIPTVLSLFLFFKPNIIVNLAIPSNKPYCPECGYNLSKNTGSVCSECGIALPNNLRDEINKTAPSSTDDSNS